MANEQPIPITREELMPRLQKMAVLAKAGKLDERGMQVFKAGVAQARVLEQAAPPIDATNVAAPSAPAAPSGPIAGAPPSVQVPAAQYQSSTQPTPTISDRMKGIWDNLTTAVEGVPVGTTIKNAGLALRDELPIVRYMNPDIQQEQYQRSMTDPNAASLNIFFQDVVPLLPIGKVVSGLVRAGSASALEATLKFIPKGMDGVDNVAKIVGRSKWAPGWIQQGIKRMQEGVVTGRPSPTTPVMDGTPISSNLIMDASGEVKVGQMKALPPAPPGITESGVQRQFIGEASTSPLNPPWRQGAEVREGITGVEQTIINPPTDAKGAKAFAKSAKELRAAQKGKIAPITSTPIQPINTPKDVPPVGPVRVVVKQRKGGPPIYEDDLIALHEIGNTPVQKSFYDKMQKWSIETMPRMFDRMPANAKKMFYQPLREAEAGWRREHKTIMNEFTKFRKTLGVSNKGMERIGLFGLSRDADGLATLTKMGLANKIPGGIGTKALTQNEEMVYNRMGEIFNDTWGRLNEVRSLAGKAPLPKIDNYMPFFRFVPKAKMEDGFSLLDSVDADFVTSSFRNSKHMMERVKGARQVFETTNGEQLINRYLESALNTIHTAPPITKGRDLLRKFRTAESKQVFQGLQKKDVGANWGLADANKPAHDMLKYFLDVAGGQDLGWSNGKFIDNAVHKLGQNMSFAVLSANLKSATIQPMALYQTAVEIGPRWTVHGLNQLIADVARPAGSRASQLAYEKSNVLISREFDAAMEDLASQFGFMSKKMASSYNPLMRGAGQLIGKSRLMAGRAGLWPLKALDMLTAKATWLGAYGKATKALQLGEQEAIKYADDVVTATQASGLRIDRSPIQQHSLGKAASLFQTFVINQWGWLTKDVLGAKGISKTTKLKKITTLLVGSMGIDSLCENVLGTTSPIPNPIGAFDRAYEDTGDWKIATQMTAKELLELIPIVGGSTRWGAQASGPIAELAQKIPQAIGNAPGSQSVPSAVAETATKGMGIPATGQVMKSARELARGERDPRAIILGRATRSPQSLAELKRTYKME